MRVLNKSSKAKGKVSLVLVSMLLGFAGCGPNPGTSEYKPARPDFTGYGTGGQGSGGPTGSTGCISIDGRIPFNASGIYADSYNIMGGRQPGAAGTSFGTVTVGGSTGNVTHAGESQDGLLQMGFSVQAQQINATGSIMLSNAVKQDILAHSGGQQLCVTGVAFDLGYEGSLLYDFVYLYFNNNPDMVYDLYF